jgi:hypothetical protein
MGKSGEKKNWIEFGIYEKEKNGKLSRKSMCQPFYCLYHDKQKRKSERNY